MDELDYTIEPSKYYSLMPPYNKRFVTASPHFISSMLKEIDTMVSGVQSSTKYTVICNDCDDEIAVVTTSYPIEGSNEVRVNVAEFKHDCAFIEDDDLEDEDDDEDDDDISLSDDELEDDDDN